MNVLLPVNVLSPAAVTSPLPPVAEIVPSAATVIVVPSGLTLPATSVVAIGTSPPPPPEAVELIVISPVSAFLFRVIFSPALSLSDVIIGLSDEPS